MSWVEPFRSNLSAEFGTKPRVAVLSTVDGVDPDGRCIVIREVADDGGISFCTDARSAKIGQIESRPRGCLVIWMAGMQTQYRLSGSLTLLRRDDGVSTRIWTRLSPPARAMFSWPPPGRPREANERFDIPSATDEIPATFVAVTLTPQYVDRLELSTSPHRRTVWTFNGMWHESSVNP